jgi:sugar/nucleoside kinase (ribokinase family)
LVAARTARSRCYPASVGIPGDLLRSGPPLPLLLVGPVTVDYISGQPMPGGAVNYGAAVATAFGIRARILTIAGPDADLSRLEGHDLHLVEDNATVTFVFEPDAEVRTMRVPQQPSRALSAADLPEGWRAPGTMVIAPLIEGDVDVGSFASVASAADRVGVMMQGLQRELHDGIVKIVSPLDISLVRTCSHFYSFFRSEREASLWTERQTNEALQRGARLVTTRGRDGAEVRRGDHRLDVEPFPTNTEVDSTGAGDVFATALILALDQGEQAAARIAAAFAAASVEQVGPAPLPDLETIMGRLPTGQPSNGGRSQGDRA